MTVLFHGNFALDRKRLAKLVQIALKNPDYKDQELAKPFGYGAPFAAIYRSWLHKTGLAEMGLPLKLTPMGKIIVEKDPSLENIITQWFMHHELVTDPERAEAWHFFALEFLPNHLTFTEEQLLIGLAQKLGPHSTKHFGEGSKLNKQILRKIIQVYTGPDALGELALIVSAKGILQRQETNEMGPWGNSKSLSEAYDT
jgi:hypothetical protein